MLEHERALRAEGEVRERLLHIRDVMVEGQNRGMRRDGLLPSVLRVRRRAHRWFAQLQAEDPEGKPEFAEDWVNVGAIAVALYREHCLGCKQACRLGRPRISLAM